jgi:hypothetical protein
MMAGIDMVHVPYRGAPSAMTDILSGQVQVYFASTPVAIEHIKAGKLRALAVTAAMRWDGLADIPTVGDFLPRYEATVWFGVGAPKSTPAAIIDTLNKEINAAAISLRNWSCFERLVTRRCPASELRRRPATRATTGATVSAPTTAQQAEATHPESLDRAGPLAECRIASLLRSGQRAAKPPSRQGPQSVRAVSSAILKIQNSRGNKALTNHSARPTSR